jgi:hypothetical protein
MLLFVLGPIRSGVSSKREPMSMLDQVREDKISQRGILTKLGVDGQGISIIQATINAKAQAVLEKDEVKIDHFENVISYLELANALAEPSLYEQRAVFEYSVKEMPM